MTTIPASRKSPMPETVRPAEDRPFVWIDGEMLPKSEARVSVWDHGLLYGDGCFEGIRFYNKRIFKCASHLNRLYRNCDRLRIKVPYTQAEVTAAMRECIEVNELKDGYIRFLVTRGVGTLGLNPFKCPTAGVIIIADHIALYPPEMYTDGMRVIVAKRPRTPTACLDPSLKSLNYLNNILAKVEAIDAGCLECIMLSTEGYVGECSGDNLFIVKGGKVFTPPLETGMLDGITRHFVINELCPKAGLPIEQKWMRIDEVKAADEIFLTGTAAEIIAVTQVDDTKIGAGKEGPVTKRLRATFKDVLAGGAPEN
jgi:branched-chain amino acid aminotransferase